MADAILTINAGSSSVKFALFELADAALGKRAAGAIDGADDAARLTATDGSGRPLGDQPIGRTGAPAGFDGLLHHLLDWIDAHLGDDRLVAVGHRIVHGGERFAGPERITPETLAAIEALTPLAPLHQPHNLAGVRAVAAARPGMAQVACFDTAFHRTLGPLARLIALPRAIAALGVRRYGFHGLSYEYIAGRLAAVAPELATGRTIVAHLGSGASLCALDRGRSVDTTMGFSALDGLVMATRCGALDPGVILYLARERGMSAEAIEDMLYHRSGLLGVSGVAGDLRQLHASDDPAAAEAIDLFVFRIAREIGGLAMTLGGLDGVAFTGGVGAHDARVRAAVCARLGWLGARLDIAANGAAPAAGETRISQPGSACELWAMATDEEAVIAAQTQALL